MTFITMEAHRMSGETAVFPRVALGALVSWAFAALGCHLALMLFDNTLLAFGTRLVMIVASGALLGKLCARLDTNAALIAGVGWAALAIATEIYFASNGVKGWFELLGNPTQLSDWMRGATIVTWMLAPSVAATSPTPR
ncbi:MAG: hypothetical protein WC538_04095 [Thermoanaerobaculia bacterium]|jgi:hypothetical protein